MDVLLILLAVRDPGGFRHGAGDAAVLTQRLDRRTCGKRALLRVGVRAIGRGSRMNCTRSVRLSAACCWAWRGGGRYVCLTSALRSAGARPSSFRPMSRRPISRSKGPDFSGLHLARLRGLYRHFSHGAAHANELADRQSQPRAGFGERLRGFTRQDLCDRLRSVSILIELLLPFLKDAVPAASDVAAMQRLLPVLRYIDEHLGEEVHNDGLAKLSIPVPSIFATCLPN